MSRIPLPTLESMNPQQRAVYDNIVSGPRGRLVGPLRAVLHNPDLAERWQRLGEILRFDTVLPPKLNELAALKDSASYVGVVSEEVQSAVLGKKDAKQAAADMQARIEKLLN